MDENGKISKPFLLPQEDPETYYDRSVYSYNVPDFVNAPILLDTKVFEKRITSKERIPVSYTHLDVYKRQGVCTQPRCGTLFRKYTKDEETSRDRPPNPLGDLLPEPVQCHASVRDQLTRISLPVSYTHLDVYKRQVLAPNVEIITLTRDMALSRDFEINYLKEHGFEADFTKLKYSYNVGLWGTSICGGEILDSAQGLPESAYLKQVEKTGSEQLRIEFKNGEVHAVNGEVFEDKIAAIQKIEEIGAAYGIGRDMHVGDTIIGIKGRVGFEAAAPMLIIGAHRFLEKYTLSKWQQYWKDQVANWYGMFLHESQYRCV